VPPGRGTTLEHRLLVEVAGSPALTLQTADERLNASGAAGDTTAVQLVVRNTGSAPLQGVRLSASPPTGWAGCSSASAWPTPWSRTPRC
jgi:uncharacterized membrane protein